MHIVTGSFESVNKAEHAVSTLRSTLREGNIGVFTRDSDKGNLIAEDLGRDFAGGFMPDSFTDNTAVYSVLPDAFGSELRKEGMPDDAMRWVNTELDHGRVLLVVDADGHADDARRIIHDAGGMEFEGGVRPQPQAEREMMAPQAPMREVTGAQEVHLPIVEEEVSVEKSQRQIGEVRVTEERTSSEVEVPMTVRHDEIHVERHALEHPVHPDEYKFAQEEGMLRMPIVEEEVHVVKTPIIREEIIIHRVPISEEQTIRETVMRTEPHVETTGNVNLSEDKEAHRRAEHKGGEERPAA